MNLAALLVLYVAVFISLFIGCITFLKNKESYTNRLFFALILNLVVWLVLSFQTVTIQNADLTNRVRAILTLAVLQVAIHFLLIFTYPYSRLQLTYMQSLTYIILSCAILTLTVSPLTLKSVYVGSGDQIHIQAGYGMILFVGYVLATILTGFVKLIKSLKSNKGIEKSQAKVLFLGALILWIIVPATNFFIPLLFSSKYFNGLFSELLVVTYILLISFGITQSKLFNIRKAILRSALSSLLSASGLLFYSLLVSVVFVIAKNKNFRFDQLLFVCSAILVVVLTLPLFKKYFNNITQVSL